MATVLEVYSLPNATPIISPVEGAVVSVDKLVDKPAVGSKQAYRLLPVRIGDHTSQIVISWFDPAFIPAVGAKLRVSARPKRQGDGYTGAETYDYVQRQGQGQGQVERRISATGGAVIQIDGPQPQVIAPAQPAAQPTTGQPPPPATTQAPAGQPPPASQAAPATPAPAATAPVRTVPLKAAIRVLVDAARELHEASGGEVDRTLAVLASAIYRGAATLD